MSGMIRRLRWKIVGISMLFVTLVLAAVFTGVMLTARSSLEQSSTRQLEKALRGEGYDGQNGQPCFVTEVYSSGTVRVMGSSYYQISEEDLRRRRAESIQNVKKTNGRISLEQRVRGAWEEDDEWQD